MVNLLGETNASPKPRNTNTSSSQDITLDNIVTPPTRTISTPRTISNQIAISNLDELFNPRNPQTSTPPPTSPSTSTPKETLTDNTAYGNEKYDDEDFTCPEGYTKNLNRNGKFECFPNYNPNIKYNVMPLEDNTNTNTNPKLTNNLKPLLYGIGILVGVVIISKLMKSN